MTAEDIRLPLNIEDPLRNTLVSCLSQQLSELELLQSMYPNADDIILTDNNVLKDIHDFLNIKSEYTPNHLDFVINLQINGLKLETCINLPSFYPEEEPDIYIRCNQLNRQQETKLNYELSNYLKINHLGDVCLYTAISWLQENIDNFCTNIVNDVKLEIVADKTVEDMFVRHWIFSHHIYNKKKRDEIIKKAKDLNITGFCVTGKPGIICIEGFETDCKEWWKDIKALSWKKIMIRKTETFEISEREKEQKFFKFEEVHFQNPAPQNNKHADMRGFSKFMEERGLSQAFNEFFGLCSDL